MTYSTCFLCFVIHLFRRYTIYISHIITYDTRDIQMNINDSTYIGNILVYISINIQKDTWNMSIDSKIEFAQQKTIQCILSKIYYTMYSFTPNKSVFS